MNDQRTSPFRSPQEKAAEREEKREAVLLAAVQAFNERGFHATSLDDVATSLGISKPTIYYYLGNKDQVLLECLTRGISSLWRSVGLARDVEGTGFDRLRAFLLDYGQVMMGEFGRCVARTGDEQLSQESAAKYRSLKREIDHEMRSLVADGIADRSIRAGDVRIIANTLAGAMNDAGRWYRPGGKDTPAAVATAMVDILINGLAGD